MKALNRLLAVLALATISSSMIGCSDDTDHVDYRSNSSDETSDAAYGFTPIYTTTTVPRILTTPVPLPSLCPGKANTVDPKTHAFIYCGAGSDAAFAAHALSLIPNMSALQYGRSVLAKRLVGTYTTSGIGKWNVQLKDTDAAQSYWYYNSVNGNSPSRTFMASFGQYYCAENISNVPGGVKLGQHYTFDVRGRSIKTGTLSMTPNKIVGGKDHISIAVNLYCGNIDFASPGVINQNEVTYASVAGLGRPTAQQFIDQARMICRIGPPIAP